MQVRVVKRAGGKVDLMVISQGHPPLPPLVQQGVPVKAVAAVCGELVGAVARARSQAIPGGTTVPGHNGARTFTSGQ